MRVHKVLSTPPAPEHAILQGIRELGLDPNGLRVIHGSTVATNAVLEGKGVRTLYLTNRGLGDLLTIGRQARDDLYDLQPPARRPPVPRDLCLETGGRLGADGSWVEPLVQADLDALRAAVHRLRPQAVAINLLFSYLDDSAERALAEALPEGMFVSRSSRVLPVTGEYERGIATWLNAWVGPLVARYCRAPVRRAARRVGRGHAVQRRGRGGRADGGSGGAAALVRARRAGWWVRGSSDGWRAARSCSPSTWAAPPRTWPWLTESPG